ncbi:peptidoglycan-binding protein [Methylobacterium komagatae]|uniref:Peptidoglycan-binding protein n=1 Tax=Methylobacterium komagatae TaxID=374425 RepID=A0ABW2BEC3_9HYPH
MAGYREITVASEGRGRKPARSVAKSVPTLQQGGWRNVASALLRHGLAEGKVMCRERPGTVFGGVVAVVAAGFICINALDSQKGRHPAPILPQLPAKVAAKAPAPPTPVAKEAARDVPQTTAKAAPGDTIGDMIRAEDTTASVNPRQKAAAKVDAPAQDTAVTRAQRALTKLGYGPIKADGAMGPATKAAIEKFERDRKLPVTGEATGKTLKALESGAAKG